MSQLGDEALALLKELVEDIAIKPGTRYNHYNFEKFANHLASCRSRGDQGCECGYSAVRWNLDTLLDECEGYQDRATIDRARS